LVVKWAALIATGVYEWPSWDTNIPANKDQLRGQQSIVLVWMEPLKDFKPSLCRKGGCDDRVSMRATEATSRRLDLSAEEGGPAIFKTLSAHLCA
jgi:hypothetical protein